MPADHFNFGRRNAYLARQKRAQLGICLAALRRRGDPDLQRAVRQLARDFGFRTLRDYLHAERRHWPRPDPLFEELMHGTHLRGRLPPGWNTPLQ